MTNNMRYYNKELPEENEYVFVKLKKITENNFILVELIEYGNIEGMILFSEINNRKINIDKLFKNNIQVCVVTDVNIEKKHINLSYKKVSMEEREFYTNSLPQLDKINNHFKDMQLLYNKYNNLDTNTGVLREKIMCKLFDVPKKELFGNLINIYKNMLENMESIFIDTDLPVDYIEVYTNDLKKRIKCTDMQVALSFELTVLDDNAIGIIKNMLSHDDLYFKYECVSSPKYRIVASSQDKQKVDDIIITAKSYLENKIKDINCIFKMDTEWTIIKDRTYTVKPLFID